MFKVSGFSEGGASCSNSPINVEGQERILTPESSREASRDGSPAGACKELGGLKQFLCSKEAHRQATLAIQGLLDTQAVVSCRADQTAHFPTTKRKSLREILECLEEALRVTARQMPGSPDLDHRVLNTGIRLKGSLASLAVKGGSIGEAIQNGSDIDLMCDGNAFIPNGLSDQKKTQFAASVAVLWMHSLIVGQSPEHAIASLDKNRWWFIFHHFFVTRFACFSNLAEEGKIPDCWGLYRVRLDLGVGRESQIDFVMKFQLARPFLSDDTAFEIGLPLFERAVDVTCWVPPKEALHSVATGTFVVPRLDEVHRGALEKVLSRQARGAVYAWNDPQPEQKALIEHFIQSCQTAEGQQSWQQIAQDRLKAVIQPDWDAQKRGLFYLQLIQLFPEWADALTCIEVEEWPSSLQPLMASIADLGCFERAKLIQGLAPIISGALVRAGWKPMGLWSGLEDEFLPIWKRLTQHNRFRSIIDELMRNPPAGEANLLLLKAWVASLEGSPCPELEAPVLLHLLGTMQIERECVEQLAARCCMEISCADANRLLTPWPRLLACIPEDQSARRGVLQGLCRADRRAIWFISLAKWPAFISSYHSWRALNVTRSAHQKALWRALAACARRRDALPLDLLEEALNKGFLKEDHQIVYQVLLEAALHSNVNGPYLQKIADLLLRVMDSIDVSEFPGLAVREMRAWLRILPQLDRCAPEACVQKLWKQLQGFRWGHGSDTIERAILLYLSQGCPTGPDADALATLCSIYPELWSALPEGIEQEFGKNAVLLWFSFRHNQNIWRHEDTILLKRWINNATEGLEIARYVAAKGWHVEESSAWRVLAADMAANQRNFEKETLKRLIKLSQESEENPPKESIELLGQLVPVEMFECDSNSRLRAKRSELIRTVFELGLMWAVRWDQKTLLQRCVQSWVNSPEIMSGGASVTFKAPLGLEELEWFKTVLEATEEGVFRQIEADRFQKVAEWCVRTNPLEFFKRILLSEETLRCVQGLKDAVRYQLWMNLIGHVKPFWGTDAITAEDCRVILRQLDIPQGMDLDSIQPSWVDNLFYLVQAAELPDLEIWCLAVTMTQFQKGVLEKHSSSALHEERNFLIKALRSEILQRKALRASLESWPEMSNQMLLTIAACTSQEEQLWDCAIVCSQALQERGIELHLPQLTLEVLGEECGAQWSLSDGKNWQFFKRIGRIQPGFGAILIYNLLKSYRSYFIDRGDAAELLYILSSLDAFQSVFEETPNFVEKLVKEALGALGDVLIGITKSESLRPEHWELVLRWLNKVNSKKLDRELIENIEMLRCAALNNLSLMKASKKNETFGEGSGSNTAQQEPTKCVEFICAVIREIGIGLTGHLDLVEDNEDFLFAFHQLLQETSDPHSLRLMQDTWTQLNLMHWSMAPDYSLTSHMDERVKVTIQAIGKLHAIPLQVRQKAFLGMIDQVHRDFLEHPQEEGRLALMTLGIAAVEGVDQVWESLAADSKLRAKTFVEYPPNELLALRLAVCRGFARFCKEDIAAARDAFTNEAARKLTVFDRFDMFLSEEIYLLQPEGLMRWVEGTKRIQCSLVQPVLNGYSSEIHAAVLFLRASLRFACLFQIRRSLSQSILEEDSKNLTIVIQSLIEDLVTLENRCTEEIPDMLLSLVDQVSAILLGNYLGQPLNFRPTYIQNAPVNPSNAKVFLEGAVANTLEQCMTGLLQLKKGSRLLSAYQFFDLVIQSDFGEQKTEYSQWIIGHLPVLEERIRDAFDTLILEVSTLDVGDSVRVDATFLELRQITAVLCANLTFNSCTIELLHKMVVLTSERTRNFGERHEEMLIQLEEMLVAHLRAIMVLQGPDDRGMTIIHQIGRISNPRVHGAIMEWTVMVAKSIKSHRERKQWDEQVRKLRLVLTHKH